MSQVVCTISPKSQQLRPDCFTKRRYQLPEPQLSPYLHYSLRHPNQPFTSSPCSASSSPLSSSSSLSSMDSESDNEIITSNPNNSSISIDGEVDLRVDIIPQQSLQPLPSQQQPVSKPSSSSQPHVVINILSLSGASAPPLSDDDHHDNKCEMQEQDPKQFKYKEQMQEVQQEKKEADDVCIICYEEFEPPQTILVNGANRTPEELEEIEAKEKIRNFCQTCRYDVHHKCIDDYRLSKVTDAMKNNTLLRHPNSMMPVGTFGIKCLICSRQVENIHISRNGDIDIVKTQGNSDLGPQQQMQIQEILHNRMQRRRRRRDRMYCLKDKLCMICFCLLILVTILVLLFRTLL